MDEINQTRTGRKRKLRPGEYYKTRANSRYTGVVMLEKAGDAQKVTRLIRRELRLSILMIQTECKTGILPTYILYLRDEDIPVYRDRVIEIVEGAVEAYLDDNTKTELLEILASV